MKSLWQKISIASASFGLMLGLIANSAQAALFDFAVYIDSGPLNYQSFFGSFNFDESEITGVGEEFLPVSQLTFSFLGSIFTENDDLFDTPEVSFLETEFLGLSFSAENSQVSFSFIPGFFEVSEASFAYQIILSDEQGFGKVTFEQVPEPHSILGMVTAVGFGTFFKWKLRKI